jgi:hypothetical protein
VSLHDALLELAEPFLSAAPDTGAALAEAQRKLVEPPSQAPEGARGRRVHARQVHEHLLQVAREVNAVLEAAVEQEALRLVPLAMTLDWLVMPPPEASLTRELALLSQREPLAQRVGEVAGVLGSIQLEAGEPAPASEALLEVLLRVRLARVGARVDHWLEQQVRRNP